MLDPKIAQKLMSNKRVMKEFVFFIKSETDKLNTITDIGELKLDPTQMTIEIHARELAYTKLVEILNPLLNAEEEKVDFNNKEYIT